MDNQKQTQKNKISELIESALDSIRGIADAGTVIGTPITTEQGTTIIPVSKVSIGFAGGGNDFTGKTGNDGKNNFSGGGGTGISVTPTAFLVISADGKVELMNLANPTGAAGTIGASVDALIDKAPDLIEKIKSAIAARKKKNEAEEAPAQTHMEESAEAEPTAAEQA